MGVNLEMKSPKNQLSGEKVAQMDSDARPAQGH
jgi:hypothetical protein